MAHTYGDKRIVEWLNQNEYHPRSPRHGSASCLFFIDDLLHESDRFQEAARKGNIVYGEDHTVGEGQLRWNIDLVVGPPKGEVQTQIENDRPIAEGEPSEVWLAIDAKSVMTEHGKARRNRQRDINSFADIMYHHYPGAITGGILLINMAEQFRSPLRDEGDITKHENIAQLVEETVDLFRDIDRADGEIDPNVDAVATIVVEHTNIDDNQKSTLVEGYPAPESGDPVYYQDFLNIIIESFEERFLVGDPPDMASLREADTLRRELNEQLVEIASIVHRLGIGIEKNDVKKENIDVLRNSMSEMDDIIDKIEDEYY